MNSFFLSISERHPGTLFMGRDEEEAHQEALRVGLFLIQTQEDLSGEISLVNETLKHNIQKERSFFIIIFSIDPVSSAELSLDNSIAVQRQTRNPEVAVCKMISLRYERSRGTHRRYCEFCLSSRLLYFRILVHLYVTGMTSQLISILL